MTFNSLSRDHRVADIALGDKPRHNFQLPLSGSQVEATINRVLSADDFQLPLSGSPSPIPGFFGSPRLSAAAPLRTNDS